MLGNCSILSNVPEKSFMEKYKHKKALHHKHIGQSMANYLPNDEALHNTTEAM